MSDWKYRPDIDGLRAVAVVLVLLFHGKLGFQGGFVGVDVFFVISGFVITGLFLKEHHAREFCLYDFWLRRVRRILPACAVMVVASLTVGYFILFPDDYQELALSAIAVQTLSANHFFLKNTGYFSGNGELKPLLHTWSLAVEEQFYLVYPLVLMLLGRLSRRIMVAVLVILALGSLIFSEWLLRGQPASSFYLMPARAWELLLGGLVCLVSPQGRLHHWLANLLGVAGLAGILVSAWLFDANTIFPGISAALPCVSAALVLYANSQNSTWSGKLLSFKPIVFVGLISYSLYLWHWPILSFARYLNGGRKLETSSVFYGLAASLVMASLSWKYLETPFRTGRYLASPRRLLLVSAVSVLAIVASSKAILFRYGLPDRFDARSQAYAAAIRSKVHAHSLSLQDLTAGRVPTFGSETGKLQCLIWGDSHAMSLVAGLDLACKTYDIKGFQVTHSGRPPILDFIPRKSEFLNREAQEFNRAALQFAIKKRVDFVVLGGLWSSSVTTPRFEECFQSTVNQLIEAGIRVAIVRDVAVFKAPVPLQLATAVMTKRNPEQIGISKRIYGVVNNKANEFFDPLATDRVTILDPAHRLVDEKGLWRAEYAGVSMYRDHSHLSKEGSLRLEPIFARWFDLGVTTGPALSGFPKSPI